MGCRCCVGLEHWEAHSKTSSSYVMRFSIVWVVNFLFGWRAKADQEEAGTRRGDGDAAEQSCGN